MGGCRGIVQSTSGGGASPYVFQYYIAPNGDDNNNGLTPATAWSITALNSKQSTYAGKVIGIIGDVAGVQTPIQYGTIGGVQSTLYALYQALPTSSQVLVVNGGTSGASPTVLASCNSSGVYTPRWAIIDASQPGTGNKPTTEASLLAQNTYFNLGLVANWGNTTIDGLTLRYFTFSALQFYTPTLVDYTGVIIKNCEIYGGNNVSSSNNPGAIWMDGVYQAQVINNKIHDCVTTSGGEFPGGMSGIITFASASGTGLIAKYNTIYNCGAGIYLKDLYQYGEIAYNYLDVSAYWGGIINASVNMACPGPGTTLWVHHNICVGSIYNHPASANHWVAGVCQNNNNTHYGPTSIPGGTGLQAWNFDPQSSSVGKGQFYNNLVWSDSAYSGTGGTGEGTLVVYNDYGITGSSVNYNCYGSNASGARFGSYAAPPGTAAGSTFATWQAAAFDPNSITIASSPFSTTPTLGSPATFALNSGGAAYTAGTGGTIAGAVNSSGSASDSSGRIGCNF